MIVQFMDNVTGTAVYVNPVYVVSLRPDPAAPTRVSVVKLQDGETIRVQGCSTYEPVVQRAYTGDAKTLNRRVEVEATGTLVKDMQDNRNKAATTAPAESPGG